MGERVTHVTVVVFTEVGDGKFNVQLSQFLHRHTLNPQLYVQYVQYVQYVVCTVCCMYSMYVCMYVHVCMHVSMCVLTGVCVQVCHL